MEHQLTQFNYDRPQKLLTAWASDLRLAGFPKILRIRSHHTGEVKSFMIAETTRDAEGDVQAVHYCPLGESVKVSTVTIFNT